VVRSKKGCEFFLDLVNVGTMNSDACRFFLVLMLAALNASASATDGGRWQTLAMMPREVRAVLSSCAEDLDSGVTPRMLDGMNRYIEGLEGIILKIGREYYSPPFTPKLVSSYVDAVNVQAVFESTVDNPGGEFAGTIEPLEVRAQVAGELENTISRMVEKITEDETGFSLARWKSEWSEALKK
jgi:hypothetical protein